MKYNVKQGIWKHLSGKIIQGVRSAIVVIVIVLKFMAGKSSQEHLVLFWCAFVNPNSLNYNKYSHLPEEKIRTTI